MTEEDHQFEKKLQRQNEMCHEKMMHTSAEYCMNALHLDSIHQMIEHLSVQLSRYGHEYSTSDILDELRKM